MNIKECYNEFNGNFKDVLDRLLTEERIKKFALRFLDNNDLESLQNFIASEDWNNGFIVAHTLKGLALNLGFTNLAIIVSEITEILRPKNVSSAEIEKINNLITKAKSESDKVKEALKKLK